MTPEPTPRRRGRPPYKGRDGVWLERLNLRVDIAVLDRLATRALVESRTISDVARECLLRGLDLPVVKHGDD